MAFIEVASAKSNVAMRTAQGEAWSDLPATGNTEVKSTLASCAGCPKLASHNPCDVIGFKVPQGETSWQDVPLAKRLDYRTFKRVFQALWQLDYILRGWIGSDILFNAGEGGDNATQYVDYEVVSVSGATLTLKGANPKRLTLGRSIPNPDFPETPGALATVQEYFALRPGAGIEFLAPSVLAGKLRPYIASISPPASNAEGGVTFTAVASCNVSNAREPLDAFYPPADGKYYCRVWFTQFHDAPWPNAQPPVEALFSPRTQTITRAAAVSASGTPALVNTSGGATRVIPAGVDPATTPALTVLHPDGDFPAGIAGRIVTVQSGYLTWATTINVADLLTAHPGATGFEVTFYAESVAGDSERLPHRGQCGNCQKDETGSYTHHDGWRCTAVECSQFATFKRNCWQPNASRFNLADESGGYNSGYVTNPAADARNGTHWSRFWTGASWYIRQGIPGLNSSRNFSLVRATLPGIEELLGGWRDDVPNGYFASQAAYYGAAMGAATWGTDGDGNDTVAITFGAFMLRETWDATTTPTMGNAPDIASTWTGQEAANGGGAAGALNHFPAGWIGRTSVYSWSTSGGAMSLTNRRVSQEVFITGADPTAVDTEHGARLRARAAAI